MKIIRDFVEHPPFELMLPERIRAPFLIDSPHSGSAYPDAFLRATRLDATAIRRSEDAFVDELCAGAVDHGLVLMRAHFPRAYLDVNREPWELDPQMFADPLSDRFNTTSPRVAAGLGTIARVVAENKPIYRELLTLEDARMRIEGIYLPYHATLQRLLSDAVAAFGVAVLIDCHSMPRIARSGDRLAPDIVLGDRYGTTCATGLIDLCEMVFAGAGLRVARNRPYAGGFIARTYGRPQHGIHALQVEISRHLYMNEVTLERNEGFNAIRQLLDRLTLALIGYDMSLLTAPLHQPAKAAE